MGEAELYRFPVERIADNRLKGILRELAEAIQQEDNPEQLRNLAQSLRLLTGRARSKGFDLRTGGIW